MVMFTFSDDPDINIYKNKLKENRLIIFWRERKKEILFTYRKTSTRKYLFSIFLEF